MERRKFTREFKLEAVKLIQERGVTVAQAVRDLGVQGSVLRRWVQECAADSQQARPTAQSRSGQRVLNGMSERARRELFHETWSIRAGEDRSARLRPIKAHPTHNKPKSTMLTATPITLPATKNMNISYNMTCASQ
jgi:transposase-like protein